MKIQCQLATCTSNPPSVGPKIGPTCPAIETNARAEMYWSPGTRRSTARRPIGNSIEPPTPCTTRAIVNCVKVCASPQNTEPTANTRIAAR